MKRITSFLLAISIVFTFVYADPEVKPYVPPEDYVYGSTESYSPSLVFDDSAGTSVSEGYFGYKNFIKEYNFKDIKGNDKYAAVSLAAMGVLKDTSKSKFRGNDNITNIEAISILVSLLGQDEKIFEDKKKLYSNTNVEKFKLILKDAYVDELSKSGILTTKDIPHNRDASRQDIAHWIVKAANLGAEQDGASKNVISSAKDRLKIYSENYNSVASILNLGLMSLDSNSNFNPKESMKRKDFVKMLAQASVKFDNKLGLELKNGIVVAYKKTGLGTEVTLRNSDNKLEKIRFSNEKGFPVLSNDNLYESSIIKQHGTSIEYYIKDDAIVLAKILTDGSIKNKIVDKYIYKDSIEKIAGKVISNTTESIVLNGKTINKSIIRVLCTDGRRIDFKESVDYNKGIYNEIIVKKNASFISPGQVKKGDDVIAYIDDGNLAFIDYGSHENNVYFGTLKKVTNTDLSKFLVILTDDGQIINRNLKPDTKYRINGYSATLSDLKPGCMISIRTSNYKIEYVDASSYLPPEGYIPKRGKIEFYTVKNVYDTYFTVKENNEYVGVSYITELVKNGKEIPIYSLYSGDKVKAYYDDIYSEIPSRIVVQNTGVMIGDILKAQKVDYIPSNETLNLKNIKRLRNTYWESIMTYGNGYRMSDDIEIFNRGKKISKDDINGNSYYRSAYLLLTKGENKIKKLVFINGTERKFNDIAKSNVSVSNRLKLGNRGYIVCNDDTIYIENNRIVSKDRVKSGKSLELITEGSQLAKIVNILSGSGSLDGKVFIGTVDIVDGDSFEITNYTTLQGLKLPRVSNSYKRLYMSDESEIYLCDEDRTISSEEFYNGHYSYKDKDIRKSYSYKGLRDKRYYGIFFTDGEDELISARIRFKGLFSDNLIDDKVRYERDIATELNKINKKIKFSKGRISSFDSDWKRASLYDAYKYYDYHREWKKEKTNEVLNLKDALIIKNGKIAQYKDLRLDDSVYAIMDDENKVLLLMVED